MRVLNESSGSGRSVGILVSRICGQIQPGMLHKGAGKEHVIASFARVIFRDFSGFGGKLEKRSFNASARE